MPRIGHTERDRQIETALAARAEFDDPTRWRRSKRGNLWRQWENQTVTVFAREGGWWWCVADEEQRRFSRRGYASIAWAKTALAENLLEDVL